MNKLEKTKRKLEKTQIRKQKKKKINDNRKQERLRNCPFDVDMNGLYGTCNCGGENRESCAGDV